MKLASFRLQERATFGVVTDTGVIDLQPRLARQDIHSLRETLAAIAVLDAVAPSLRGAPIDARLDEVTLLPPIPDPAKIICVGLNYEAHRIETGRDKMKYPVLFTRFADTQVGHGQPLVKPLESDKFDFEGELAVVIGRGGRRIAEEAAMQHVAGYSCYHDGSVRDWQGHSPQFTPGKNFPGTGGFGPWLVTPDEAPPPHEMVLTTRLNGAEMQKSGVSDLIFSVPQLIAYISRFTALTPGDVIATGTPGGVGYARKPPIYMKAGDIAEVAITGIGTLVNPVIAEKSA
jgi:2-keto-4-pentenoate hydratase/2-oxohepta-3-ene-1,7-dioic acid hydratase in catechol pathway